MSLIEAAKRLAGNDPVKSEIGCHHCAGYTEHYSDCPWLALPKIVAALETAQDAVDDWLEDREPAPNWSGMSGLRSLLLGEGGTA